MDTRTLPVHDGPGGRKENKQMDAAANKRKARERRHTRVRKVVAGTPLRPRLAVYRSNTGIYAQVIDDRAGKTLAAASSLDKDLSVERDGKIGVASAVG